MEVEAAEIHVNILISGRRSLHLLIEEVCRSVEVQESSRGKKSDLTVRDVTLTYTTDVYFLLSVPTNLIQRRHNPTIKHYIFCNSELSSGIY
jgi:hypothetical protein